jgi:hypothetical protein
VLSDKIAPQRYSAQTELECWSSAHLESSVIYLQRLIEATCLDNYRTHGRERGHCKGIERRAIERVDRVRLPTGPRHASDGSAKLRNDVAPGEQQRVAR